MSPDSGTVESQLDDAMPLWKVAVSSATVLPQRSSNPFSVNEPVGPYSFPSLARDALRLHSGAVAPGMHGISTGASGLMMSIGLIFAVPGEVCSDTVVRSGTGV